MSFEPKSRGLYYVMPATIMESEELTPMEKLCYILLNGVADSEGKCFPGDAWIAKKLSISEDHAGKIVRNLTKYGLIEKETGPHPENSFRKQRTITIIDPFKKLLRTGFKDGSGGGFKDGSDPSKMTGILSEDTIIHPPSPHMGGETEAKASSNSPKKEKHIDHVFLTKEEHQQLLSVFGEVKTNLFIKKLDAYIGSKGKKYKSHYKTILSWNLKDEEKGSSITNENTKKGSGIR